MRVKNEGLCRTAEKVASSSEYIFTAADCILKAPIYDPQKLLCVGMNYVDHCKEQNYPVPEEPVIFSKFASAITEPNGAVILPDETDVSKASLPPPLCSTAVIVCISYRVWITRLSLPLSFQERENISRCESTGLHS